MKQLEDQKPQQDKAQTTNPEQQTEVGQTEQAMGKSRGLLFPILLLLIVLAAVAAAAYLGWQEFSKFQHNNQQAIQDLQSQLALRPTKGQLDNALRPLQQSVGNSDGRIRELRQQQESLLESTTRLYELYGRDENGWKLAEVEYLMSIAQHKLLLERDFEGAAKTLDAASSRIAEMADPGLLPVRIQINEEVAALKTRKRPDLVGMTLLLARLGRQITVLTPEYVAKSSAPAEVAMGSAMATEQDVDRPLDEQLFEFVRSLVTVKRNSPEVDQQKPTKIIDVRQKLEDNLKLTRWTVLERDAVQYDRLMNENIQLFTEYYDLDDAANADFHQALISLQQSSLSADFPDISGSLTLLREIQQKRENTPQPEAENG